MRIVLRPEARRDILLQIGYFADEMAFEAASRFQLAIEETMNKIQLRPGAGPPCVIAGAKWRGLRSWPVSEFEDIRVYYIQASRSLVRVIRILHGKRDIYRILQ
jgi:plasmid stabilization system protein ParE